MSMCMFFLLIKTVPTVPLVSDVAVDGKISRELKTLRSPFDPAQGERRIVEDKRSKAERRSG